MRAGLYLYGVGLCVYMCACIRMCVHRELSVCIVCTHSL